MILFQLPISIYSAKVRLAFALQGVEVELREPPGGTYRSTNYRALVPAGTIPALVDGDLLLTESDAIIEYVDETYAGTRLVSGSAQHRARVRMLSRYHDLHLEPCVRSLFPLLALKKSLRAPSADEVSRLTEKLTLIDMSADAVGPFLAGAAPSMADCGLAASIVWLTDLPEALGFSLIIPPRLQRIVVALEASTPAGPEVASYRDLVRHWIAGRASQAG